MKEVLQKIVDRHLKKGFTDAQRAMVTDFLIVNGDLLVVTMAKHFSYEIINTLKQRKTK